MLNKIENNLVPLILIVIACIQLYYSQFGCLSPWKGAGFGMFSTNKENNLNAIGYLSNGDSILIKVKGNKYDVPISRALIRSASRYPRDKTIQEIGSQMLNAHYKLDTLEFETSHINRLANQKVEKDSQFYKHIYTPEYYQNVQNIENEQIVMLEKVKIIVFQSNFYDQRSEVRKTFLKETIVSK